MGTPRVLGKRLDGLEQRGVNYGRSDRVHATPRNVLTSLRSQADLRAWFTERIDPMNARWSAGERTMRINSIR
jgi:hypothetical protein